ncbi:MAG: hypothetical protein V1729_02375 [Candidatus Woesearchaeota archaeon]
MGIIDWFKDRLSSEEEIQEDARGCDRCGFEYPEHSMVISGESLYCGECSSIRKRELADMEFKKKQEAVVHKIKYYCYNCKFNFSRKKDFGIKLCPNCGSENFVSQDRLF